MIIYEPCSKEALLLIVKLLLCFFCSAYCEIFLSKVLSCNLLRCLLRRLISFLSSSHLSPLRGLFVLSHLVLVVNCGLGNLIRNLGDHCWHLLRNKVFLEEEFLVITFILFQNIIQVHSLRNGDHCRLLLMLLMTLFLVKKALSRS